MAGGTVSIETHATSGAAHQTLAPRRIAGGWIVLREGLALVVLLALIALIAFPMIRLWASLPGDFAFHSLFAEQMRQVGAPTVPHFVYHGVLAAIQELAERFGHEPMTFDAAAMSGIVASPQSNMALLNEIGTHYALASIITCLIFTELLGVVIWLAIRRSLSGLSWGQGWLGLVVATALTLAIFLIGPVAALVGRDDRMYFGYIGLNVWHSPTMLVLKPLAVLAFFYAAAMFVDRPASGQPLAPRPGFRRTALLIVGGAIVTVLGTMSKPNYTLCLLPGIALFVPWAWYTRMTIRWTPLMLGLVLPAMAVLAWQYSFKYQGSGGETKNSIIFAPLLSVSLLSPKYIAWKFLLSIIFPAVVWVLFLRGVWADRRMVLAWLVFDCSLAWSYLAAESARPHHGNFVWGAQMALFILFLESIRFLLRTGIPGSRLSAAGEASAPQPRPWWPIGVCAAAFLAHVGFGLAYNVRILHMLDSNKPGWW